MVRFLTNDMPRNDWQSVGVCSDGSYGVEKGLISSFPVGVRGDKWEIVQKKSARWRESFWVRQWFRFDF